MAKYTITSANALADIRFGAEDHVQNIAYGDGDVRVDPYYSGRGMYGKECLAVELPRGVDPTAVAGIVSALVGEATYAVENPIECSADAVDMLAELVPQSDSMGLGTVLYWPNVTVEATAAVAHSATYSDSE